jgi:hypothetical protein
VLARRLYPEPALLLPVRSGLFAENDVDMNLLNAAALPSMPACRRIVNIFCLPKGTS